MPRLVWPLASSFTRSAVRALMGNTCTGRELQHQQQPWCAYASVNYK